MSSIRLDATRVYLIYSAFATLAFATFATLSSVYRIQIAGLDALQLILVGTVLELAVFVFEVPTGVVADLYSRRMSVIIGLVLIGCGFVLEGLLPLFSTILLAQLIWGVGATFESGAIDAWISDEVGVERANQTFLRAAQIAQLLGLAGIGLSVVLARVHLALPLVVAGGLFLGLALTLILIMGETGFERQEGVHNPIVAARRTFGAGLDLARRKPLLWSIFAIAGVLGASSETFDRLWEAHFLADIGLPSDLLEPLLWFGLINAGAVGLAIVVTEVVRRRVDTNSHYAVARALFIIYAGLMVAVIAFGLAGSFVLGLACYWAAALLRRTSGPLFRAWLNQSLESATRATVFSMTGQMDALGQIAGGPLLGLLASGASIRYAFVASGALILPALLLVARSRGRRPVPEEVTQEVTKEVPADD